MRGLGRLGLVAPPPNAEVRVVAEGLVSRLAAAAEGEACAFTGNTFAIDDADAPAEVERTVALRSNRHILVGGLVRTAIEPLILEGTARAGLNDGRDIVGCSQLGPNPAALTGVEDVQESS